MEISNKIIRLATPDDAEAILNIYAPYIQHTSLTFEQDVPSIKDFESRIENYLKSWPWLVCEIDGKLAGYAYASRYRERVCYQWSVECSVYIHDDYKGFGIATVLYEALMHILKKQGFVNVYAVINLPNPGSVSFHERFGFKWFATFNNVGYKLGEWKNVGWWQLMLNQLADNPPSPVLFEKMDKTFLNSLFDNLAKKIKRN